MGYNNKIKFIILSLLFLGTMAGIGVTIFFRPDVRSRKASYEPNDSKSSSTQNVGEIFPDIEDVEDVEDVEEVVSGSKPTARPTGNEALGIHSENDEVEVLEITREDIPPSVKKRMDTFVHSIDPYLSKKNPGDSVSGEMALTQITANDFNQFVTNEHLMEYGRAAVSASTRKEHRVEIIGRMLKKGNRQYVETFVASALESGSGEELDEFAATLGETDSWEGVASFLENARIHYSKNASDQSEGDVRKWNQFAQSYYEGLKSTTPQGPGGEYESVLALSSYLREDSDDRVRTLATDMLVYMDNTSSIKELIRILKSSYVNGSKAYDQILISAADRMGEGLYSLLNTAHGSGRVHQSVEPLVALSTRYNHLYNRTGQHFGEKEMSDLQNILRICVPCQAGE